MNSAGDQLFPGARFSLNEDGRIGLGHPRQVVLNPGHRTSVADQIGRGVGLANIRARLRALHGDAAYIVLEDRAGGGTHAVIEVPA